jgi:alkanesulfonate monooxygenase SsuD/methylene tetrahydromethanopterin reductase-like flavin-dependent oxidoreductase (luciferase family)
MELAALERIAPGRLVPGFGHGVQEWMGQAGVRVGSPLTLLREYVAALRALLAGDEVTTTDNRYVRLDRVRLAWPPQSAPALHIGTEGPRSLHLSGELADGTILTGGTTPDGVRAAREHIEEGRRAAGSPRSHRVTVYLRAATGPDADERLAVDARRWDLDPVTQGVDAGVAGDAEAVAAAVRRWAAAGADAVILQPTEDDPEPESFVRFAAAEVAPLLA